jgi:hypothetical protein
MTPPPKQGSLEELAITLIGGLFLAGGVALLWMAWAGLWQH